MAQVNPQILDQLDTVMRELIDASVQMQLQRTVLDGLRQRIMQGEEIVRPLLACHIRHSLTTVQDDVLDQWEKGVKAMRADYIKKTSRQKYAKDNRYHKFKESVWVCVFLVTTPAF